MSNFVVPMFESERGWGSKIDGYAGPFETIAEADAFVSAYNKKYNSAAYAPDYYILAQSPIPNRGHKCDYRSTVE